MTSMSNTQPQNAQKDSYYLFGSFTLEELGTKIGLMFGKNSSKRTSSSQITWTFGSKTCFRYEHTAYMDSTYTSRTADFEKCDSYTYSFSNKLGGKGYVLFDLFGEKPKSKKGLQTVGGYKKQKKNNKIIENGIISFIHRTDNISDILKNTKVKIYSNRKFSAYDILITAIKPFKITIDDWIPPVTSPPIVTNNIDSDVSDIYSLFSDPSDIPLNNPNNPLGTSMMVQPPSSIPYGHHRYAPMHVNNQQSLYNDFNPYSNLPNGGSMN